MLVLESPVKKSLNKIKKTPVFKRPRSGSKSNLITSLESLRGGMVSNNIKLNRQRKLPTDREIDIETNKSIRKIKRIEGGGVNATTQIGIGAGLVGLGGLAVDAVGAVGDKIFNRGAKKGAQKATTKATTKAATKAAGKGFGKGILKKIPLIGLGLGAAFAISRAKDGDFVGAFGELASGAASLVPGWGTAASVAIDAGLMAKDVKEANSSQDKLDEKLDEKRDKLIAKTTRASGQDGLMPSLEKLGAAVKLFENFSFKGSPTVEIGPGTETDINSAGPNTPRHSGEYPGFDSMERVAPFVTGHVSTYPGAQFGAYRSPTRDHAGQDIADQDPGDPVLSVMKGTVIEVGTAYAWQQGGGTSQTIGIRHPDGSETRYVHVMSNVSVGDEVLTGQKIGTVSPADVGSSPDFAHLHFEMYAPGGALLDPRPFLNTAPKGTPGIAPVGSTDSDPKITPPRGGDDDTMSAPTITVGDSIAEGVKGNAANTMQGANPTAVLAMLMNLNLKGKTLRLSSGISNNTSQLDVVRRQLEYAREQGAANVELMGTSFDRSDLAAMNPKLEALAKDFPGFVKFAGGFKSTDTIHPNYEDYRQRLNNLRKSSVLGAAPRVGVLGVEQLPKMEMYPSYNQEGGSPTFLIMESPSQQPQAAPMPRTKNNQRNSETTFIPIARGVNSIMDELLLTKLSKS